MSRDKNSSLSCLSCLIVVLFGFFIRFIWENERSVVQFVKNIRKLISTFGKSLSMLSNLIYQLKTAPKITKTVGKPYWCTRKDNFLIYWI
jgi:hypothetical protein